MILAIIIFILILGFLIFIHELGHFFSAKKLGVKVEEFGIGYPPTIWKKKKGETIYSINIIPFGGFVKLYGEEGNKSTKDPKSFSSRPPWQRAVMIISGVAMNFLLAVVIFYFLLGFSGFKTELPLIFDYEFPFGNQENFPMILGIAENSPAEEAGLKFGDVALEGNGIKIKDTTHLINFIGENKGEEITLTIRKSVTQEIKRIEVVPRVEYPEKEGSVGIALRDVAEIRYDEIWQKPAVGFLHSLNLTHYSLVGLGYYIKTSLVEREVEPLASSVVGPVGILAITKLTIQEGVIQLITLLAIISLALFIVNILPIPPLDGGMLAFLAFEGFTKKKVSPKIAKRAQEIGVIFFIILFILVTSKDLLQFKDILFKGF
jgi:regulator of sigma E protease